MTAPDESTLRTLYLQDGKSLAEIGRLYGVHKNQVRRWLLRAAISTRSVSEGTKLSGKCGVQSEQHREALRQGAAIARAKITPESYKQSGLSRRGLEPHNKGKKWTPEERERHMAVRATPEYRENLAASLRGEQNHNWRGGHESRAPRGWRWKQIRLEIYERDNWTCQDCGERCLNTADSKKNPRRKIQCHHIIPRRLGGQDTPGNLVTLCMSCHHKRERRYQDALIA